MTNVSHCQRAAVCPTRQTEAKELLLRLGFRYRLADCVLRHNREDDACHGGNIPDDGQRELMAVVDNALPKHLLSHLQVGRWGSPQSLVPITHSQNMPGFSHACLSHLCLLHQSIFGPGAPFWSEHGYCSYPPSPYFSYMHELDDQPASSLDQVCVHLLSLPYLL